MASENLLFDNTPIKPNKLPLQPDIEKEENFLFSGDSQEISEIEAIENSAEIESVEPIIETETQDTSLIDSKEDEIFYFTGEGKEEEISTWDKLEYGFDKNDMVTGNLWRWGENAIEALFDPNKNLQEVSVANEAERVKEFEEEHWKMLDGKSDGAYTLIGEGASFILDPYYLAGYFYGRGLMATPLTSSMLNAALLGGDSFIEQMSKKGKVDYKQVGKSAAIGAGIGLVFPLGAKLVSKLLPNAMKGKVEAVTQFMDDKVAEVNGVTRAELTAIRTAANKESVKKITNKLDDFVTTETWQTTSKSFSAVVNKAEETFLKLRSQLYKEAFDIKKARKKILEPIKGLTSKTVDSKTYFREVIKPVQERAKAESKKILDIRNKIAVAKDAWLKQDARLKVRASKKIEKYMRLEGERTAAILAELAKTENIGHKFLKAVLANFTRPLVGGVSGGAANVGFSALGLGDSEDDFMNWVYAGAFLGLNQKFIQKSIKIPLGQKNAYKKIIGNTAVRYTFQRLRELTAGTVSTKLNSFGGATQKISRLIFRQVDDPLAEKSAIAQAESMERYFLRKANNIIQNSTPEMQIQALSILRGNTVIAQNASKDVLKLAGDLKGWMNEFKVLYNKAGFFSPKELDNYFPRVLNWEMINADRDYALKVFTDIFKKNYKLTTDEAKLAAKNYLEKSEGPGVSSVINQSAWKKIIQGSEKGVARKRNTLTGEDDLIHTPISDHITKQRALQGEYNIVEGVLEKEGFLMNNLNVILPKIVTDSTKSIAFARVFGKGGALLRPMLEQIKQKYDDLALKNNKLGFASTRTGAAKHETNLVLDSIDAYFDRFGFGKGRGWSSSIGILTMMSNLNMLGRVTISSLGDIVQPFQNSRSWTAAIKGLGRTNLFKATWEKGLARSLGYDMTNEMSRSLAKMAASDSKNLMLSQAWMGKWGVQNIKSYIKGAKSPEFYNNLAFKGLGLEWLTGYARRFAYNTGSADAYHLSRQYFKVVNGAKGANSRTALRLKKELYETYEITANQALTIGQGKSFNIAIQNKTAKKFLNQAGLIGSNRDALIPQHSNRLLFTQSKDPRVRMLGQFLSWAQAKSAQTNKILMRIENGDVRTLIKTLAAIPVYAGIQQLREYAKYGEVITDAEYDPKSYVAKAWQLSGMPGWLSDLVFNRFVGPGSTNSPFYVFAPALNMATNIGDYVKNLVQKKPDDAWKIMDKRLLPLPNWRNWVRKFWFPTSPSIKIKSKKRPVLTFAYGGVVRKRFNTGDVATKGYDTAFLQEIKTEQKEKPVVIDTSVQVDEVPNQEVQKKYMNIKDLASVAAAATIATTGVDADINKAVENNILPPPIEDKQILPQKKPDQINWKFIGKLEGEGVKTGYVPTKKTGEIIGTSGVTIATGVDLGTKDRKFFEDMDVSEEIILKLEPFFNLKGEEALLNAKKLKLSASEVKELDTAIKKKYSKDIINQYEKDSGKNFEDLTSAQQTVITSVAFQHGLKQTTSYNFWDQVITDDWDGAITNLRDWDGTGEPSQTQTRRDKEADLLEGLFKKRKKFFSGDVVEDLQSKAGVKLIKDFIAEGFSIEEAVHRAGLEIQHGGLPD